MSVSISKLMKRVTLKFRNNQTSIQLRKYFVKILKKCSVTTFHKRILSPSRTNPDMEAVLI
jgi:hypothetical protein